MEEGEESISNPFPKKKGGGIFVKIIFILLISLVVAPFIVNLLFAIGSGFSGDWIPLCETSFGTFFNNDHRIYEITKEINYNSYLIDKGLEPKYDYKDIILLRTQAIQHFIVLLIISSIVYYLFYKLFSIFTSFSVAAIIYAIISTIIFLALSEFVYVLLMGKWATGSFELIIPFHGFGIIIQTIFNKAFGLFPNMMNYADVIQNSTDMGLSNISI